MSDPRSHTAGIMPLATYAHDEPGRIATVAQRLGAATTVTTTYLHDAHDNLTTATDADGNVKGHRVTRVDLQTSDNRSDAMGRVVSGHRAKGDPERASALFWSTLVFGLVVPVGLVERCVTLIVRFRQGVPLAPELLRLPPGFFLFVLWWWVPFVLLAVLLRRAWSQSSNGNQQTTTCHRFATVTGAVALVVIVIGGQVDTWLAVARDEATFTIIAMTFGPIVSVVWLAAGYGLGWLLGMGYARLRRTS